MVPDFSDIGFYLAIIRYSVASLLLGWTSAEGHSQQLALMGSKISQLLAITPRLHHQGGLTDYFSIQIITNKDICFRNM